MSTNTRELEQFCIYIDDEKKVFIITKDHKGCFKDVSI